MKTFILLLLLLPVFCAAQDVTLKGKIKDNNNQPVPYAGIRLITQTDSIAKVTVAANENGTFQIKAAPGSYTLTAGALGFADYAAPVTVIGSTTLPDIILTEEVTQLNTVEIMAKKPIVKRKIDRLEFNVENSIMSSGNAWDILRNTPGVTASAGGGLSIRGSSGIMVTINDKRIYMSGEELKQLLENTQGEDIKAIEVITNPPAKYEAQGSAVLNIKMKKNPLEGYRATVSGAYVQSMYPKGVVSTSQFYKNKNLSVNGSYSFGSGTYIRQGKDVVHYLDDNGNTQSKWESILNRKNRNLSQNSYNLTAEYAIDSLTTVTAGGNGFISMNNKGEYNVPTLIYNGAGIIDSLYTTRNRRSNPLNRKAFNASFEHLFDKEEKIYIASDYTDYKSSEFQDIYSAFSLPGSAPYRDLRFVSDNTNNIKLFSAQADYFKNSNGAALEAGARMSVIKADNDLNFEDEIDEVLTLNPQRTSRFLYDENIYAAYGSYSFETGKWSFKGGLRSEFTKLTGNSVTIGEVREQEYFKLFPTAYTMYKANEKHELGLSYGKRINRPQYTWLNPFRSYYNLYSYFTGDPALQPAIIHNLSFLYTLKNTYNFDLYYRYQRNPSMEISYQEYETNTLVYRYTNIKNDYAFGLDFNTNLTFYEWWEASLNASVNYKEDTFQGLDGRLYSNGRISGTFVTNNRFALNKSKDFTAECDFFYFSPSVQGTFKISGISSLAFSFRKQVLKSRGEISLRILDIYRGQKQKVTTDYANQYNYFYDYSDTQSFRLGFKYNFGNQKLKNKTTGNKTTEEQQRL